MSAAEQQVNRRKPVRKSRSNLGRAILVLFITLFLLLGIGISAYAYFLLDIKTFYPGVAVDGISLEKMSIDQAKEKLWQKHQPTLDEMKISLRFGDETWEYDHKSINAAVNVDVVVEEAYKVGRTGNILDRLKEISAVKKEGKSFETKLTYDTGILREDIQKIADKLYIEPVDAGIAFHNKEQEMFTFTPEVIGRQISVDEVMAAIKEKTDNWDFTPYEIKAETLNPKYTLEEVKTWTSKLATFETGLSSAAERNHNITLSSSSYDGIRIDPGQVFSLNEATGPRGISDGYKNAPVIINGIKLVDEPGGGNCQTSTTLYGAIVRADMEIVERWNHSWPSTYTEVGQDAMVDYPNCDLKFRNPGDSAIFISRIIKDKKLIVEIYGKKSEDFDRIEVVTEVLSKSAAPAEVVVQDPNLYQGVSVVEYKSRPEIKTQSYRVYYKDGKEVKRVKEAYTHYRKITGKKRVGTKPKPAETTPPADTGNNGNNG
jgi:vancomycin resistance protein YoaR